MKPEGHLSRWRSPEAEERFRAREAALVVQLATERGVGLPEPRDVCTALGPTRAYRWAPVATSGPAVDRPPIVLLHGTTANSLMWVEAAERIRATGRAAYGIDTIGDVGHSRQDAPVTGPTTWRRGWPRRSTAWASPTLTWPGSPTAGSWPSTWPCAGPNGCAR